MHSQIEEGIALQRQGKLADAKALYQAVLLQYPDDAPALHYLGLANYQAGELQTADALMTRSLALDPACANTWNDLGVVKLKDAKPEESIGLFARALALNSKHTDAMNNMATALKQLGRFEQALVALRRLASLRPGSSDVLASLADAYYHAGNVPEAVANYYEALWLDPDCKAARLGLAEACESGGKFRQARWQYLAVLRRDPNSPLALSKLLQLREGAIDARWVQKAEQLVAGDDIDREAKTRLNIALGHHHDRAKSYDTAFGYLKRGCDEQARKQPFDSGGYCAAIDTLIEVLTQDFFRSAPTSGNLSERPIFIVGMPRSGTTLTEQILASHSQVAAAGELAALPNASYQIQKLSENHRPYPQGLTQMTQPSLAGLAREYLAHVNKLNPAAARVTDKLPFNFMHLGVIALLFPKAKIIHCRRDPIDNCLSCYFTSFADEIQFANDLGTLGRYYADYHRLMKHWHEVLPVEIFDLQYEDLVEDTPAAIGGLLRHCDLDWEEACLKFYETQRGIRTPSRWQVRQPIYRQSVARWRNYELHLAPLRQALGPLAEANDSGAFQ